MASSALEQLRSTANLIAVWDDFWQKSKGKRSSGIDWVTPLAFKEGLAWRVQNIRDQLGRGYTFLDLRGVALPKKDTSKYRLICIPTVADRVVQRALLKVIEPRSASLGIANDVSYGFVKAMAGVKRGTHAARVAAVKGRQQRSWVFKTDISKFFDSIQRD